jgi:glucan phosphoethanolaminetransferase (alkaline phosphatase superfamily)
MIPTAGRIVYFKGAKNGLPKDYPAMVVDVDTSEEGKTKLLISVFTEAGNQTIWVDTQGEVAGNWDWMPFQKDQQARYAENKETEKVG